MTSNRGRTLKLSDFGFGTPDPSVFSRAQWNRLPHFVFITYRVILALYLLGIYIAFVVQHVVPNGGRPYIFLTNLGFTVFVLYVEIAGVVTVVDGCILRKRNREKIGIHHRIHWMFFNITINTNVIVSIIYWTVLFNGYAGNLFYPIHTHAVTSIVSVADLFITAIPVRLVHCIYPVGFDVAYTVMTLIYWATGNGNVYPFLDYSERPGVAIGAIIGVSVAVVVVQGIEWALYKLRLLMWRKCEDDITVADVIASNKEDGVVKLQSATVC